MLMSLLTPTIYDIYLSGMRTTCRGNIHAIAVACVEYANDSTLYRGTTANALPNTAPTASNWGDIVTGNSAGLWLLVETGYATPAMFFCPEASMRAKPVRYARGRPGDPSFIFDNNTSTLSYSYLSMVGIYRPTGGDPIPFRDATVLNSTLSSSSALIIIGDRNPRCEFNVSTLKPDEEHNSDNHKRAGQNVGALDETARWIYGSETAAGDNVYAADKSDDDAVGRRSDLDDSLLE